MNFFLWACLLAPDLSDDPGPVSREVRQRLTMKVVEVVWWNGWPMRVVRRKLVEQLAMPRAVIPPKGPVPE